MGWCDNFKKAIEEDTIRLIEYYERIKGDVNWTREKVKVKKGFYIIDSYAEGEMCNTNYPSEPMIPLKYCPYCGATLTMEDI